LPSAYVYNCYARQTGMTITWGTGNTTYTPTSNSGSKDGANTTAYNTQGFWQNTVGFQADIGYLGLPWTFNGINLPYLNLTGGSQNPQVP